jgi:hypothetical protein
MTDQPQGPDPSPAVAALAVRVDGLRRRIETLATKADDLTSTQQEHATALDGIAELRHQVEQILALLGNADEPAPVEWFWLTMTDQQRDERLGELSDWVDTVLHIQNPGYMAGQIRPCWPNHPEARWELAWLYQLWIRAYLTRRPAPKDAADWHDRWFPGVIRRLSQIMRRCEETCQRQPSVELLGEAQRRVAPNTSQDQ